MENQKLFSNDDNDHSTMLPNFGLDFSNCYFNPNWDTSADQGDPFESALSSMVSSPATTTTPRGGTGDGMVLRELIGRLGSICNSGEIQMSPYSYNINSANTSCYNTPLNSPPKLSPVGSGRIGGNFQIPSDPALAALSANPGFAERAARYSSLGARSGEYSEHPGRKVSSCSSPDNGFEGSTVSEQITSDNGKKRKAVAKGKGKETTLPSPAKTDPKVGKESEELNGKKRKANEEGNEKEKKSGPNSKANAAAAEPPKDYIHVRARRGQATDSHSLAERVRREKISERMKFLQDLVPGCNKVIGKAVMLDEIINYVQSLQRQVEFLSMKLSTVNPVMEFNTEALFSKDVFQSRGSISQNIFPLETSFPYGYQSSQAPFALPSLNPAMHQNMSMQSQSFSEAASQGTTFWEDDLHSVVQTGFGQNQPQDFQNGTGHMKLEL